MQFGNRAIEIRAIGTRIVRRQGTVGVLASLALLVALMAAPSAVAAAGHGDGGAAAASDQSETGRLTPDAALERLKQGNLRFFDNHSEHPRLGPSRRFETTKGGQHPYATVIGCSDSRVPIELLFDEGIGDLFVIRVAGNVCDTDEIGSIEYGVDHLETPVMVVLGHAHCGAVTAVVKGAELHGSIPALVDNIQPAVALAKRTHPDVKGDALVPLAVRANVFQAVEDLIRGSAAVRGRLKAGTVKVVGAVYDIETGRVEWLGEHPDQQVLLGTGTSDTTRRSAH